MKTTSVKGTNDFLPKDSALRDFLQSQILTTYVSQGFGRIYTPVLEDIENLEKSDGGDNVSLIFKVLKRGEKFNSAITNGDFSNLADIGLRYDLTLPLCRFYAEHKAVLPNPFKVIQMGNVYRAERPQKGRDREFVQCDIDIFGSESPNCEVELIDTTAQALLKIGIGEFCIRINDRRILRRILSNCGFADKDLDSVCISFDKLDKIGCEGVVEELREKNFDNSAIENFENILKNMPQNVQELKNICGEQEEIKSLEYIMNSVESLSEGKYSIRFDLSLVRGQGYYTGAVFEIESKDFSGSIGGGGRYDNLVGKFTGQNVPAVGFSIGFERIFSILKNSGKIVDEEKKKLAIIYDEGNFVECMKLSKQLKNKYNICLFERPKKFGKLLSKLEDMNFANYIVPTESSEIKSLKGDSK